MYKLYPRKVKRKRVAVCLVGTWELIKKLLIIITVLFLCTINRRRTKTRRTRNHLPSGTRKSVRTTLLAHNEYVLIRGWWVRGRQGNHYTTCKE